MLKGIVTVDAGDDCRRGEVSSAECVGKDCTIERGGGLRVGQLLEGREGLGVKSRMCPPYPQRVVKGDLLGRCVGINV